MSMRLGSDEMGQYIDADSFLYGRGRPDAGSAKAHLAASAVHPGP